MELMLIDKDRSSLFKRVPTVVVLFVTNLWY